MQQQAVQAGALEHVVDIDGQLIPLDPETAATDDNVRQALRGIYPDIATATITRRAEGRREVIAVVKRAGPKGAVGDGGDVGRVLAALRECTTAENPAITLDRELSARDEEPDADATRKIVEDAILRGEEHTRDTGRALRVLIEQQPTAGRTTPVGF